MVSDMQSIESKAFSLAGFEQLVQRQTVPHFTVTLALLIPLKDGHTLSQAPLGVDGSKSGAKRIT
jgi:hypothetical protein